MPLRQNRLRSPSTIKDRRFGRNDSRLHAGGSTPEGARRRDLTEEVHTTRTYPTNAYYRRLSFEQQKLDMFKYLTALVETILIDSRPNF